MTSGEILHMIIEPLVKNNEQQTHLLEEMFVCTKELTAQLTWFQRHMFEYSSEKQMMLDVQLSLFDSMRVCTSYISVEEEDL